MDKIISDYDSQQRTFSSFSNSLKSLIESFLLNSNIEVHTISSRVKDRASLEQKILSKGTYECLSDITDVIGVRIITHYADDVDLIAKIIEKEFSIDKENSIDKRATLEPDRFGYLSLHYIVTLKKDRLNLTEYSAFKEIKAEIQIRSILQHTWAEIEHDTGYKSNTGIPDEIRRRFSRLAGLLEIADSEFIEIKKLINKHRTKIEKDIKKGAGNIPIDQISLIEFINNNEIYKNLAIKIANDTGFVVTTTATNSNLEPILVALKHFNIKNLSELENKIQLYSDGVIKRFMFIARKFETNDRTIPRQYLTSYLTQVLALVNGNMNEMVEFAELISKHRKGPVKNLPENLMKTYNEYFSNKN